MRDYLFRVFVALLMIGALVGIIYDHSQTDIRPDKVKWVIDPRNGCELQSTLPLANEQRQVSRNEYKTKYLLLYTCNNQQLAALITEKPEDVK